MDFFNKLAAQTEDFAVQLIDQVIANEELVIRDVPGNVDRYASLLSAMTDDAIIHSQKKVGVKLQLLHQVSKLCSTTNLFSAFKMAVWRRPWQTADLVTSN